MLSWCLLIFAGVSWCFLAYPDVSWYFLMPPDVSLCFTMFPGISWCFMVPLDVSWCLLMFHGVSWCFMMFAVAGVPERFRWTVAVAGGEVSSGRRWVIPWPHQHPQKAEETWGSRKRDEGQQGPTGQTGSGKLLLTGFWSLKPKVVFQHCLTVHLQLGQEMIAEEHYSNQSIRRKMTELSSRWRKLEDKMADRGDKLRQAGQQEQLMELLQVNTDN